MPYQPSPFAGGNLEAYLVQELSRISEALQNPELPFFTMKEWHEPPPRVKDNLLLLADGENWNPGKGPGLYLWDGSLWCKIGPQWIVLEGEGAPVNGTTGVDTDYLIYFDETNEDLYLKVGTREAPEWKLINREA